MRSVSFEPTRTALVSSGLALARSGVLLAAAVLVCSALAFHTARAQLPTEHVISGPCTICTPLSVLVGDFDEDGTSDVVAGEGPSRFGGTPIDKVTFRPGTGSGTGPDRLGPPTEIASSIGHPVALAKGDVTEDGHLDVVIATIGELLVVPGNGDETFKSPITVDTDVGGGTQDMAVADFNGDDLLDVVVATTAGLALYPNEGTSGGTTAFGDPFTRFPEAHSIDVGDIGDDGVPDLTFIDRPGTLVVLENPGTANLDEWTLSVIEFTLAHHVAFTTLNNFLSILVWSATTDSDKPNLVVYPGDGTVGGFSNENRRDLNFTNNNVVDLGSFDANGDGNPGDAVEIGRDMVEVHPNFGSEFGQPIQSKVGLTGPAGAAAIGNLDEANGPDILGAQPREDALRVGINDGNGGFPNDNTEILNERPPIRISNRPDAVSFVGSIKGTSDGPDVVIGGERKVTLFPNNGEGFGEGVGLPVDGPQLSDLGTLGPGDDLKGDGDLPAQIFVGEGGDLTKFRPTQDGIEQTIIDDQMPSTIESVPDVNDDGLPEILFSNDSGVEVGLQQDDGTINKKLVNGEFSNADDLDAGNFPDVDKTAIGLEDVIGADDEGGGLKVFRQNEDGTFDPGQTPSEFKDLPWNSPNRVFAEDLNGDGIDGIVTNGGEAGPVLPFTNDPSTEEEDFEIIDSDESDNNDLLHGEEGAVGLADVNGDGFPEFVRGGGFNEWFDNNLADEGGSSGSTLGRGGSGSAARSTPVFGNPTRFASVPGVRSVAVADIDVDGDLDLVIASGSLEKVSWIENGDNNLPVELTSFEATQTGKGAVRLTWTTAAETYNSGFRVQQKTPAASSGASVGASVRGWQTIGRVEGAGTTNQPTSYQFTVEDLAPGTHQFRLEQVDLNGSTTVHDPITVTLRMHEALRLTAPTPNPVSGRATLSFAVRDAVRATVTLYNVLGQRVATLYEGTPASGEAQRLQLDTSDLSSGVYVLRLRADGRSRTRRVTVVR